MDPKKVRQTLDDLCAELDRAARAKAAWLGRHSRPIGLGLALGMGSVAGCGSGGTHEDLPPGVDAYGVSDTRPNPRNPDASTASDADTKLDTRDTLPFGLDSASVDLYGIRALDTYEALPPRVDAYGVMNIDARDTLPFGLDSASVDLYGIRALDTYEALPPRVDAYGVMNVDARDTLPSPVDAYGVADRFQAKPDTSDGSMADHGDDALPPSGDADESD
jgi:hypothetical protein